MAPFSSPTGPGWHELGSRQESPGRRPQIGIVPEFTRPVPLPRTTNLHVSTHRIPHSIRQRGTHHVPTTETPIAKIAIVAGRPQSDFIPRIRVAILLAITGPARADQPAFMKAAFCPYHLAYGRPMGDTRRRSQSSAKMRTSPAHPARTQRSSGRQEIIHSNSGRPNSTNRVNCHDDTLPAPAIAGHLSDLWVLAP